MKSVVFLSLLCVSVCVALADASSYYYCDRYTPETFYLSDKSLRESRDADRAPLLASSVRGQWNKDGITYFAGY